MQIEIITLLILLVFSAFFSGTETALISISEAKARSLVKEKKKGSSALLRLKSNSQRMIITVLIGNNIANIGASVLAAVIATNLFGSIGIGIATGIMTLLVLIFGEVIPKTYAANNAPKIALITARPIEILQIILLPVIIILEAIIRTTLKDYANKKRSMLTEEEIREMVELGVRENIIEKKEKEFIEGVLEFNDKKTREVMVPRVRVFSLDGSIKIEDSLKEIIGKSNSRIPVFEENIDNIVGVVHIRDVLKSVATGKEKNSLKSISIKPLFVSEETIISDVFKKFQKKRVHLAIVVDEFGGTSGIVTLEDLMEEIVGDIMDESDPSAKNIVRVNKITIVARGDSEIDEINDFLGEKIPVEEHYHTLNAFLLHKMRGIPSEGQKFESKNLIFEIEAVSGKEILSVKITSIKKPSKP